MKYRHKKYQIFYKKLSVPKKVRNRIYKNIATIEDFIDYDLANKIPIECLSYEYVDIVKIVGIEKSLGLDWECILAVNHYVLLEWLKENNNKTFSSEELNVLLYESIKSEYTHMLKNNDIYDSDKLVKKIKRNSHNFHFSLLGEKFAKCFPELLYTNDFYAGQSLFLKKLTLMDYVETHENYTNVPIDFLLEAFNSEIERELFRYLAPYITDSNKFRDDKMLLNIVFNSRYHFEYEKYFEIFKANPNIDFHSFLEQASLIRIEEQNWLKPTSNYISRYNVGREKKFTFGQEVNVDILEMIDKYPEYKDIFSQFLDDSITINANIDDFDNLENYIAYLIDNFNLFYNSNLPEKFKIAHPEMIVNGNPNLELGFYAKKLSFEMIKNHPGYVELLRDKNVFLGFKDKNIVNFIKLVGNDKFFELCLKYGKNLVPIDGIMGNQSYEEVIEQKIIAKITSFSCLYGYLEDISTIVDVIPNFFLDRSYPEKLRRLFYDGQITSKVLQENPNWQPLLINKELKAGLSSKLVLLYDLLGINDFLDLCQNYGEYIDNTYFYNFEFEKELSKDEILEMIENKIYLYILNSRISYNENFPTHFKEKYSNLFLLPETPSIVKEKFYGRNFTLEDFYNNSTLFDYFKDKDVINYLPEEFAWLTEVEIDNSSKIRIGSLYKKINDKNLQNIFKKYIVNNVKIINFEKIQYLTNILFYLAYSNSSEMRRCREELASELIELDNPQERLKEIENIFLSNNVPFIGKIFSVFKILHPDFKNFDFGKSSMISPILKSKSNRSREIIIFSDLLKSFIGSNNKLMEEYLENIEKGNHFFRKIVNDNILIDSLSEDDKKILSIFVSHLVALYNSTLLSKKEHYILTGNLDIDIKQLGYLFSKDGSLDYNLPDRIIKMFCYFAGFDTFDQVKTYFKEKVKEADIRNREFSKGLITLEVGDFIKGIEDIKYLRNILQNGSLSKEFLGSSSGSDRTPLDTDLSRIMILGKDFQGTILNTEANGYGDFYLVLKNRDDRFNITRKSPKEVDQNILESVDLSKLEVFYTRITGEDHYGIRTGFASSEIDYIISKNNDKRIGLEIAMNGFYIPVVDKNGMLIFSPEDYDNLRAKIAGLKYYKADEYVFDESIDLQDASMLEEEKSDLEKFNILNKRQTELKRKAIYKEISSVVSSFGLELVYDKVSDLTPGVMEIIDTGSTGRETNIFGDGDFDFMIKVDNIFISDQKKMDALRRALLEKFPYKEAKDISDNIKIKGVTLAGLDELVDLDITFAVRTDKIAYSTDECVKERLQSIREQSPNKYNLIVRNIIEAKRLLKESNIYKKGSYGEGGLGGIGIENWILQNGGSFERAAREFLNFSEGRDFDAFCNAYQIWDFGENHLAEEKGFYMHDNFIKNNMTSDGYLKMKQVLQNYLDSLQYHVGNLSR